MNDIKEKIKNVMAVVFKVEVNDIQNDAAPNFIEAWDSLKHMTLILSLEEEFEIRFTDDELTDLLNFELIHKIISSKFSDADI
jgi:acyl carrier protein